MATMSTFPEGHLVTASDWNAHANQINTNTDDISANDASISSLGSRVTTVEDKVTASSAAPTEDAATDNTSYGTTSTSYTSFISGASYTLPGALFTAPESGRVLLLINGEIWNSAPGLVLLSAAIKNPSTGADIFPANDVDSLAKYGGDSIQGTRIRYVSGLTPGVSYLARLAVRAREGEARFSKPGITVVPTM